MSAMLNHKSVAECLQDFDLLNQAGRKYLRQPSIDELRTVWADAKQRGKIIMVEGTQKGDDPATSVGLIVTTDNGYMIRVALSKSQSFRLGKLLMESC